MFDEITNILDWYFDNCKTEVRVSKYLVSRDKLAVWSYRLAEHLAQASQQYEAVHLKRKIEASTEIEKLLADKAAKLSFNRAEIKVMVLLEGLYAEEAEAESYMKKVDLLLRQVNKILDAMSQRISFLKEEQRQVTYQSGQV